MSRLRIVVENLQPGDEVIVRRRGAVQVVDTVGEAVPDTDEQSGVRPALPGPGIAKALPRNVIELPLPRRAGGSR